jgi:hypothetical protein
MMNSRWHTKLLNLTSRLVLVLAMVVPIASQAVEVPEVLTYCGTRIRLNPRQQAYIATEVDRLTKNMLYHNILVERADLYMPMIEEAFRHIGVPQDLKYIAMQESALMPDAVSSSNAVGFWQFKDYTAREVGLRVDLTIDERKHIYRASCGAALYFQKNFFRHRNWIYAVISYYTGGTGAIPHIDTLYQGRREMVINDKIHWYALKAIAHKLAFQHSIGHKREAHWLEPFSNSGVTQATILASKANVAFSEFRKYNPWLKGAELPSNRPFSCYIPRESGSYRHISDPHPELFKPGPMPRNVEAPIPDDPEPQVRPTHTPALAAVQAPKPAPVAVSNPAPVRKPEPAPVERIRHRVVQAPREFAQYDIEKEPLFGEDFIQLRPSQTLEGLASDKFVTAKRLRRWNSWANDHEPPVGEMVRLLPYRRAVVHIATDHQTIADVALLYRIPMEELMERNKITDHARMLYPGQKIYLRQPRPEGERPIVYRLQVW